MYSTFSELYKKSNQKYEVHEEPVYFSKCPKCLSELISNNTYPQQSFFCINCDWKFIGTKTNFK